MKSWELSRCPYEGVIPALQVLGEMLDKSQVAQLLGTTEIFAPLQPKHLEVIANACKVVRYEERARIVTQDEVGSELYIIARGKVAIIQEERSLGIEQPILTLGPKQSFGEASLLAETPRSATAKALTETICVVLAQKSFDSVLRQIPEVGLTISRYLAARLHRQCQLTGFRFVSYQDLVYDPELYTTFPAELLTRLQAIPLTLQDGTLTVALTKPNQASTIQALREAAPGLAIEPVACTSEDYDSFIRRHRPAQEEVASRLSFEPGETVLSLANGEKLEAPLSGMLGDALKQRVTHLIVQGSTEGLQVVTPVEGGLQELALVKGEAKSRELSSQIQALFACPEEQVGVKTTTIMVGEDRCYLQLSQLPTLSGMRYSLRILEPKSSLPSLKELMPFTALRERVLAQLTQPGQMVLLAGPSRSGRSTTTYALVHALVAQQGLSNIITLEQRPPANLANVPQVRVTEDWDGPLEAALLHLPELLVVDELDVNSLPRVLRQADAGHTTLACFQTNHLFEDLAKVSQSEDAGGVSLSSLGLVLQQTLLPRLCPHCRTDYEPSGSVRAQLQRNGLAEEGQLFFHSAGCGKCRNSGVQGKVAVLEALTLTPMIRELIAAGRPEEAIRKTATGSGLLIPCNVSAKILIKQGELGATTALRFFGRGH